jgi:hypothetical protein
MFQGRCDPAIIIIITIPFCFSSSVNADSLNNRGILTLLLDRGLCSFSTQVRHAQYLGFAAVLIADDQCHCDRMPAFQPTYPGQHCQYNPNDLSTTYIAGSSGSSSTSSSMNIHIPAMWMYKEDADAIKQALVEQQRVVRVEMAFHMPHPNDVVEYEF